MKTLFVSSLLMSLSISVFAQTTNPIPAPKLQLDKKNSLGQTHLYKFQPTPTLSFSSIDRMPILSLLFPEQMPGAGLKMSDSSNLYKMPNPLYHQPKQWPKKR
jgi:hypothetical protein